MTTGLAINFDKSYTLEEFEGLVGLDDNNRYELIDGKIVMTPPAGDEHGRIGDKIVKRIHLLNLVPQVQDKQDNLIGLYGLHVRGYS
jgi:Uma2 family endonuclease